MIYVDESQYDLQTVGDGEAPLIAKLLKGLVSPGTTMVRLRETPAYKFRNHHKPTSSYRGASHFSHKILPTCSSLRQPRIP